MKKAILYKAEKGQNVQCTACKWYCHVPNDFTGLCGIRLNREGQLYLLTHSHPTAVGIDPIEKKPLFHFLPDSQVLSIGTYGCNFACEFCQNWQLSQSPKIIRSKALQQKVKPHKASQLIVNFINNNSQIYPPNQAVKEALKYKAPSIAFTYNEPTIFAEYAFDVMKLAKKHKIRGVFVSSGYESKETLNLLNKYIDAYNIDLKGATEKFYITYSHTHLNNVLETIEEIYKRKKWLEITTLLIPGLNTSKKDLEFIANFIGSLSKNIPWHISAFYPCYKMTNILPTDFKTLLRAYKIGKKAGLNYVYTGNIPHTDTESTFCPKCNDFLIKRKGYEVEIRNLDLKKGECDRCGTKIAGVWK